MTTLNPERCRELQAEMEAAVQAYLDNYELCGDEWYYTPNEQERLLIADAIWGLIEDDDFRQTFMARRSLGDEKLGS